MATEQAAQAASAGDHVLHVVSSTQRRGAETFALDLAGALASRGLASPVVALVPSRSGPTLDLPVLGDAALAPSTLRALRRRARGAGVVVAHGSRTLPACTAALAGCRTTVVYRSIGDPAAWAGSGLRRLRTGVLLRRMAAVVVLWPGAGESVRTLHGVAADRVHVVPNGVPARRCPVPDRDARQAARRRLGLPPEEPVVAVIGALAPEKRVGDAIAAVGALDGTHLLVVGDGPERRRLEQAATARAPDRVHFAGVLPGAGEALAATDVVAMPSRTEGMPGVLIEAGLSGIAAVATDVGGVSEIVKDGETGLLVAPADVPWLTSALRVALAERVRLGAAARRHCLATFEIGAVADRWVTLLAGSGVGGRPPGAPAGDVPGQRSEGIDNTGPGRLPLPRRRRTGGSVT